MAVFVTGKVDLKRDEKQFYSAPTDGFVEVDVAADVVPADRRRRLAGIGRYARAVEAPLRAELPRQVREQEPARPRLRGLPARGSLVVGSPGVVRRTRQVGMALDDDDPPAGLGDGRPGRLRAGEGDREGAGGRRGRGWPTSPRVSACRSCTSAASRTRPRRSRGCTTSTSRPTAWSRPVTTTRSTSPTRARRRRRSSGRSSVSR